MGFLAREYPHMLASYERLYAGAYASADYVRTVRGLIEMLQERYGLRARTRTPTRNESEEAQETPPEPQAAFEW
jgi:hypothetical protein